MFHDLITLSNILVFFKFINLFFKIVMYCSSADFSDWFRLKGKSRNTFAFLQNLCFLNYGLGSSLGGLGCLWGGLPSSGPPPVGAPLLAYTCIISISNHPVSWLWCFGAWCRVMLYIITNVLEARMQAESFYGKFLHTYLPNYIASRPRRNSLDSRTCENLRR
jgi:hypothetical protein